MNTPLSSRLNDLNYASILRALDALSNWRVALLLIGASILALAVAAFMAYIGTKAGPMSAVTAFASLGLLMAAVIWGAGFNAAGVLLHDEALDQSPRPTMDAIIFGLMCLGRMLALGLMILLIVLVWIAVMAVVYFACKIPGVGPLLFTFAYPVFVVISGVMLAAVIWLAAPILLAALWDGMSVTEAIAALVAVARERLVFTILLLVMLSALCAFAAGIISGLLSGGFGIASSVAVYVMGSAGDVGNAFGRAGDLMGVIGVLNSSSGYAIAGAMGGAIVVAVAAALVTQIAINGITLVYLQAISGLDLAAARSEMEAGIDAARQKAAEAKNRAIAQAQQMQAQAQQMQAHARERSQAAAPSAHTVGMSTRCPKCQAGITPDDVFCGACGTRVKT